MAWHSRPRALRGPGTARPPGVPALWPHLDLLGDFGGRRGAGRHVEQLVWRWHGPLDTERFTAAWQSVVDRESVLRAALAPGPRPHLVLHEHAHGDVVRHRAGGAGWDRLLERDRRRGLDPSRPCPLRVTLVERTDDPAGAGPVTRVVLTFHHALLDAWSVCLLMQELCRAYLAGGELPGGERRPDLRDWAGWLQRQDPAGARDFWRGAVPDGPVAVLPARPGPRTRQRGRGRTEVRLSPAEAERLHRWAALRAVPDSSALETVWALLLYRAAGPGGAATVGFGVTVSGRGITLDCAERLPGPLRNCLPMVVRVDPGETVGRLLTALRDRALDMAAYEWVSTRRIHRWTGRCPDGELLQSVVSVDRLPRPPGNLRNELAGAGIALEPEPAHGACPDLPVALLVRPGGDGRLTFCVDHDRNRISDADARLLAGHCARLLRHLPGTDEATTNGAVLDVLAGEALPRIAPRPSRPRPAGSWLRPRSTSFGAVVDRAASHP
ncbi:condensation domain-containing protein [Streptomyces rochei]|uniref:condensation domain-containing protein n=1 Tax=Streptomyces rochei TaxID=1928 RepID=UPI0033B56B8E